MKEPIDDWGPPPKKDAAYHPWRSLTWGLLGAVSAVALAVLLSALRGLFFGQVSAFYGTYEPGWNAAAKMAIFMFFLGGLPIAGIGFAVGLVVGLVKNSLR
jgi:hypothetical protein